MFEQFANFLGAVVVMAGVCALVGGALGAFAVIVIDREAAGRAVGW